jgi:hypothetical protein
LPVFHVIEPEIRAQVDEQVYQAEVGMAELALEEPEAIVAALRGIRSAQASPGSAE